VPEAFNIVRPQSRTGQKDAQQAAVLRRMIRDLTSICPARGADRP
jgi:pantothenate synthetase